MYHLGCSRRSENASHHVIGIVVPDAADYRIDVVGLVTQVRLDQIAQVQPHCDRETNKKQSDKKYEQIALCGVTLCCHERDPVERKLPFERWNSLFRQVSGSCAFLIVCRSVDMDKFQLSPTAHPTRLCQQPRQA